jgi:ribonucleoside-diphosphate reductase alpha chain
VLPRFESPEEFGEACRDMALFLTAGSVYSDVPYEKVADVRDSNRRLGLGLIGVHEFLMKQGVRYGTPEAFEVLEPYMVEYARTLEYAHAWQDRLGLSRSLGATAIAPNGTIGIIAESTPSADPLFSAAEVRNVKVAGHRGDTYERHVVVDPVAARLVREGVDPRLIEDAATLSMFPERRLAQQAFLQRYTDHAISSTLNLPGVITETGELLDFGETFMEYLPQLRGITVYPDGARAGQPRNPVDLEWALEREGTMLESVEEICAGGVCGV